MSSSDEDDDSPAQPAAAQKQDSTASSESAAASTSTSAASTPSPSKKEVYDKDSIVKEVQGMERRKVSKQAQEALKELYGDDYDELIGMEDQNKDQNNLKSKLQAKFGQWFS